MKNNRSWRLSPVARAIGLATMASMASAQVNAQQAEEEQLTQVESQSSENAVEQQSPSDDSSGVERITVTANKREQDLQDVAQSIMALDGDQLEKMGVNSFEDYAKAIPSLSFVSTTPGRNEVVFRGISTGSQEWRTDSSTAVYLDDIPMTSAAQQVDPRMVDIQRVEALPGPQGTIMGSSSQSGALRIITNKPEVDGGIFGAIEAEYSQLEDGDSSHRFEGHINIPIIDDVFAIRVAGFTVEEGGYIDNIVGEDLFLGRTNEDIAKDDFNTWGIDGGRIIGLWHINDEWDAQFTYLVQNSSTHGDWKSDEALGDLEIVRFHEDVRNDDWWAAAITVSGDLGFGTLTYTTSHLEREIFYEFDAMVSDQLRTAYTSNYFGAAYDLAYNFGTTINDQIGRRTTHELRLASNAGSDLQWLIGAFYETTYDAWDWYWHVPNLTDTPAWTALQYWAYTVQNYYNVPNVYPIAATDNYFGEDFERQTDQTAVFGEIDYSITEKLSVGVGLRWFKYERERTEISYWPQGVPWGNFDTGGVDYYEGEDSDVVKRFNVKYNFDDSRMVYFTYSEGFRLGGDNNLRPASVLPDRYEPDKLFNHELGLKSTWFDNRIRFNLALYYMSWEDMQREVWDPNLYNSRGHANTGDVETKGVELSFTAQVTDNFKIDLSMFKNDTEATEDVWFSSVVPDAGVEPQGPNDWRIATKGQELAISPNEKAWIGLEYTFPEDLLGASWWARYDHSYYGEQYQDWGSAQIAAEGQQARYLPSYQNASFQLGAWINDNWEATFSIWNVWDERGASWIDTGNEYTLQYLNSIGALQDNRYQVMPNYIRPREYGITLKYHF